MAKRGSDGGSGGAAAATLELVEETRATRAEEGNKELGALTEQQQQRTAAEETGDATLEGAGEAGGDDELQEALEKIVNNWILDYVFHIAKRLYDKGNYVEFGELRDIMQMVIQRPFEQTFEAMMKLRVFQLMSRLAEAQNLEAQFEDDILTPMESALQVLILMQDELKLTPSLTELKELFKIQSVILCLSQNEYSKAAEVFKRQFGDNKIKKSIRDKLSAAVKNRNAPESLVAAHPFNQILQRVNAFTESLLKSQLLPFLLNASSKVLKSKKEANARPAADNPGTSSGTGGSDKVLPKFLSRLEVRDTFVALNELGCGDDERTSLNLFKEMEDTDFLPKSTVVINKLVASTKKAQASTLVEIATPSNTTRPDTALTNKLQTRAVTLPNRGGGEKYNGRDNSTSSSDGDSLQSLHKRLFRKPHKTLNSELEDSDTEGPQIVKKTKMHKRPQVNGKNGTGHPSSLPKPYKRLQSIDRKEMWTDSPAGTSHNTSSDVRSRCSVSSVVGRRKRWSVSETIWLKKGVKRYGTGNWAKILESYNFVGRSNVMLKDRWRTLVKLGEDKLDV